MGQLSLYSLVLLLPLGVPPTLVPACFTCFTCFGQGRGLAGVGGMCAPQTCLHEPKVIMSHYKLRCTTGWVKGF